MTVSESPAPFTPLTGYKITASGGVPPYEFVALPSPPNPPGVVVDGSSNPAKVNVPITTTPGTVISVSVSDSSTPAQTAQSQNTVV